MIESLWWWTEIEENSSVANINSQKIDWTDIQDDIDSQNISDVVWQLKKSKEVAKKIKKTKKENLFYAKLLKILIENIDNDIIWNNINFIISKWIENIKPLFILFYYFLNKKISDNDILENYSYISVIDSDSLSWYTKYIEDYYLKDFNKLIKYDQFLELTTLLIYYFNLWDIKHIDLIELKITLNNIFLKFNNN